MMWGVGYAILWLVAGAVVLKDLLPLLPHFHVVYPGFEVCASLVLYIVFLALLGEFLPGKVQPGALLVDGRTRLIYKCNGLLVTILAVIILSSACWFGLLSGSWIPDHYGEVVAAANVFAIFASAYLFAKGRLSRSNSEHANDKGLIRDFVMGTELNPMILGVNVKFFSYRPAMAGWLIVNLSFLHKQYTMLGFITSRMLLYQVLSAIYIFDYFVNETKIVTTWDIIAERFGLMLVWGDYFFIPFAFSLQNFFLLEDTHPHSYAEIAFNVAAFSLGFLIFRGANSQKHQFKTDPKALIWGEPPKTVRGKLLVSGFWGFARHMNYTGDLLIAISFSLPCGKKSALAYFYFIYLLLLTVHREKRDDDRCAAKYGRDWDEYCTHVPYRMVPFLY